VSAIADERIALLDEMLTQARGCVYSLHEKYRGTKCTDLEIGFLVARDVVTDWKARVDGDLGTGSSNVLPLGEDSIQ
jgi:hypothetical protein